MSIRRHSDVDAVLRDAAAEFAVATDRDAVDVTVRRAVARLTSSKHVTTDSVQPGVTSGGTSAGRSSGSRSARGRSGPGRSAPAGPRVGLSTPGDGEPPVESVAGRRSDLVRVDAELPGQDVRPGALLVDRRTAARPDLSVALQTLSLQAALALDRVRLSTEIAERAAQSFGALVEQTADIILIVDDDNRIRYASPSARGLLGTSTLRDVSLPDLVDPAERRPAEFLLQHARQAGGGSDEVVARADWTIRTRDGRTARVEVSCRDLRGEELFGGLVVTLRDVTAQRQLEHELTKRLFNDPLTGLANRLYFCERLSEAIAANTGLTGIFLIDLDNFRAVNEALGREVGDAVIKMIGARLRDAAGEESLTARLEGDEFAVLVRDAAGVGTVEALAQRILQAVAEPVFGGGENLSCSACIGIATTGEAVSEQELLRHADLALDAAKVTGAGHWRRYEPSMTNAVRYRLELRSALGRALQQQSLVVEYQPIVALITGRTAGFEALVRWQHPSLGLLSPGEFIDIAEESGLITPIGEWVLATAVKAARGWCDAAPRDSPYVSVNVSAQQFRSAGFTDTVHRLLIDSRLPPSRLVLEITESLLLRDDDEVWEDMRRLRQWGVRVAIDDFGTGYSALGYLRQVPLDIVKLDRLFISTMATSQRQRELVRGIVGLTRTLNLEVVAEGIETRRQRDISEAIGCTYGQGYFWARSMSDADAIDWLARERRAAGPDRGRHARRSTDGRTSP